MAIIDNPITLKPSKFLVTMTSLINEQRFNETLAPSSIVNEFVDGCRVGNVEYGKGIQYNYKKGLQPVKQLTETSSAFTIVKPQLGQETIEIDNYDFIPLSYNLTLAKDALLSGDLVDYFLSFIMSLMEDSSQFDFFDKMVKMYMEWEPGQASQTITIDLINTDAMVGAELKYSREQNANKIAKVIRKTMNNMKIKNTKFTDNVGIPSCLNDQQLKLVMNDKFETDFLADTMASLYHGEKVGDMIPRSKYYLLPEDCMDSPNTNTIGWLSLDMKFAHADFYKVALSIVDPSTGYTNMFLHRAYGEGVFKFAPGVKFVANYVAPAK